MYGCVILLGISGTLFWLGFEGGPKNNPPHFGNSITKKRLTHRSPMSHPFQLPWCTGAFPLLPCRSHSAIIAFLPGPWHPVPQEVAREAVEEVERASDGRTVVSSSLQLVVWIGLGVVSHLSLHKNQASQGFKNRFPIQGVQKPTPAIETANWH